VKVPNAAQAELPKLAAYLSGDIWQVQSVIALALEVHPQVAFKTVPHTVVTYMRREAMHAANLLTRLLQKDP